MVLQYKTVIFDLDGTLLDTSEGLKYSLKYTIKKFGLHELTDEQLNSFIGPPVYKSFARVYNLDDKKNKEITAEFRKHYKEYGLLKARPYDGIFDVFRILSQNGIKPAVATYKREDYAKKILVHFGFDKYTDLFFGADFSDKLTKKDIIENALNASGITDYSQGVMVGDSDNDAIGAEELNIDFIGVTYGFGFKTKSDIDKYRNVASVDNSYELIDILTGGRK